MPPEDNPADDYQPTKEDWDEYEGSSGCFECGGRGYIVTCIDGMCHGQEECIHGSPASPCRNCNPKGEREDSHL